jgi:hypothetical protein
VYLYTLIDRQKLSQSKSGSIYQKNIEKISVIALVKHNLLNLNMGRPGFEPGTNRLKAECSTAELATHVCELFLAPNLTVAQVATHCI